MRPWLIALVAVVALVLGAIQVLSTLALRDAAQPGAWVRFVPADVAARVDALDPRVPVPPTLRIVFAREALARGDVEVAARQIAALPPSRDRAELSGVLAERRGDDGAAVRAFLEAGAVDDLERHIAEVQRRGDVAGALRLQAATVERLRGDRAASGGLPEAQYRLGVLEQTYAYTLPVARREPYQQRSLQAYEAAVALAPLAERYLVAAGNEELNLGDVERARRYFGRAREVNPTSVDAVAGLGDAAFRRGDVARARAYLGEAQKMDATAPAVRRLAAEIE
jgi:tetratricopeptide (TPR) repeat protein